MPSRLTFTLAALSAAVFAAACSDDATAPRQIQPTGRARGNAVVPARGAEVRRSPSWRDASDTALWQAAAKFDTTFVIGLKAPGSARGIYHGIVQMNRPQWTGAIAALKARNDLELHTADSTRAPYVSVKIRRIGALALIRRLPFVDYVEPRHVDVQFFSSGGCGPEYLSTGQMSIQASNGGYDIASSKLPAMGITSAWSYSTGAGVTIGLTDQGVDDSPGSDFDVVNFASGDSYGRTFSQEGLNTGIDEFSVCDHGTRMANLMAAPRNGRGVVGVAYRANVFSDFFESSPLLINQEGDAMVALDEAYRHGSKVVVMAWGALTWLDFVSDIIDQDYYVHDVLFVGAAGTCVDGSSACPRMGSAVFPAEKAEVLAATGNNWDGSRPTDNYDFGDKPQGMVTYTSLATVLSQSEGGGLGQLNGSSAATAVMGGVAALVRSRYPSMTNTQVMDRLVATSDNACHNAPLAWRSHFVNALAAVGGPCVPGISGHGLVTVINQPNSSVTYTYSIAQPTGDNASQYQIMWSNGATGLSTTFTWGADPFYGTRAHRIFVNVTDPVTGVMDSRYFDVMVTTRPPNDGCAPGLAC